MIFVEVNHVPILFHVCQLDSDVSKFWNDARWVGGDGGIFTGTRLEMESNFEVGGIEVEFWVKIERIILEVLHLDFRKTVILLMFLKCLKSFLYSGDLPIVDRPEYSCSRRSMPLEVPRE